MPTGGPRRQISGNCDEKSQTIYYGLRSFLLRIGEHAGVRVNFHALRRTFATMSLRAGMSLLQLHGLLGHSTIEMTCKYVQMIDDDLPEAHKLHGPFDNILQNNSQY
jgi:site-specific recombinase XerD